MFSIIHYLLRLAMPTLELENPTHALHAICLCCGCLALPKLAWCSCFLAHHLQLVAAALYCPCSCLPMLLLPCTANVAVALHTICLMLLCIALPKLALCSQESYVCIPTLGIVCWQANYTKKNNQLTTIMGLQVFAHLFCVIRSQDPLSQSEIPRSEN